MSHVDVYPGLSYNGKKSNDWQYVRMTINKANKAPVEDVMSDAIRCDQDPSGSIAETLTVTAGSTIGFASDSSLYHPGALQFYMAKVPEGDAAASWDGSGAHWFKIYQDKVTVSASGQITWPSMGKFFFFFLAMPVFYIVANTPGGNISLLPFLTEYNKNNTNASYCSLQRNKLMC